jgi:ABC-type uncharacterized transport system involved in gliding motility auxiliary subunit
MATNWTQSRQTKFTSYVIVYVAVVIAILAAINFLANRYNKSFDTTSNKRYSLSDQTVKVVKNLQQDVKITIYDKTERFARERDLLDRYGNLSTKLKVEFIDPYKNPQLAKAAGIRSEGQIVVESGAKREEARGLSEEELTGAIIRTLKTGERVVCAVLGSGERSFAETAADGLSGAKDALERNNYKTKTIKLLEKPEVPKDCTILLIDGPKFDYIQPAVDAVKAFGEAGGDMMVFLGAPLRTGKDDTAENAALMNLFGEWGVAVNKDLVIDTSGIGRFFGYNEFIPLVVSYESHPIVREMKDVATAFPLARSIEPKTGGKGTATKLFSSAEDSFATNMLDIKQLQAGPSKDKKGPVALAAALTFGTAEKGQARVVVVGSAEWATNSFIRFNGNRDLFLNITNWLSSDEDLISIRPKEQEDRKLNVKPGQGWVILMTSFLPVLVVLIGGVMVWWRRR